MVVELPADTTNASVTCADASPAGDDEQPLSEAAAERLIGAICFKTGPPGTIGAELEWLVRDSVDPLLPVELSRIREVLEDLGMPGVLPGAGLVTLEPGGQVELSTAPAKDLSGCVTAASGDLAVLHDAFGHAGLVLTGHGIDPLRRPTRVLKLPRYAAMEEYFDRDGHWGRVMMCSTASVQVCVDAGLDDGGTSGFPFRWRLLHALGPVLVAAFANSPLRRGRPTGWKCTRQLVWARLNPGRTRSPGGAEPSKPDGQTREDGVDLREHWARYALDAEVLCVRRPDGQPWTVPTDLTFRDWLRGAGAPRAPSDADMPVRARPTVDDLSYHLSTLFPPVRPRGHLELRMIDAQHGDRWVVPVAVVAALADDPVAADAAMTAAELVWHGHSKPPAHAAESAGEPAASQIPRLRAGSPDGASPWLRAASLGLADPALARAGRQCFEAAEASLARSGTPPAVLNAVRDFADKYVERGRCPADDVLDAIGIQEGQS
jgi:ergothioneine biosynthesis glutamate--cysteine ligase EgtA